MEIAEPAYAEYIDDSRLAGPGRLQLTLFEELAG
jgi:hypothetical protein